MEAIVARILVTVRTYEYPAGFTHESGQSKIWYLQPFDFYEFLPPGYHRIYFIRGYVKWNGRTGNDFSEAHIFTSPKQIPAFCREHNLTVKPVPEWIHTVGWLGKKVEKAARTAVRRTVAAAQHLIAA